MKTKFMFISCTLALIMGTAMLWAKDLTVMPQSPTNKATAELDTTEGDRFMSTTDWGGVSFNKVFGYVDMGKGGPGSAAYTIDVGVAFKAGPVYIGSLYKGNLGRFSGVDESTAETTLALSGSTITNTQRVYRNSLKKFYDANHNVAVLIGFGNMGFQLGYKRSGVNASGTYGHDGDPSHDFTHNSDSNTTNTNVNTTIKTTYDPKGFIKGATHRPFVAFGMNIPVGTMTISPTVGLEVAINQAAQYGVRTVELVNNNKKKVTTDASKSSSDAYLGINGQVGAGIALSDSLNSFFNIKYDFEANIYSTTYKDVTGAEHKIRGTYNIKADSRVDDNGYTTSGRHTTTDTFEATITEKSYFNNKLTPGYSMKKAFNERLSLFAGIECPVSLKLETDIEKSENTTVTVTKIIADPSNPNNRKATRTITDPEKTKNTTAINIAPKATAAISYAVVPERFTVNLGTELSFLNATFINEKVAYNTFVQEDKTVTKYDDGRETTSTTLTPVTPSLDKRESVKQTNSHDAVSATLKGGFRWNIVDNFAVDFVYSNNLLDTNTGIGDLKLAATIKF